MTYDNINSSGLQPVNEQDHTQKVRNFIVENFLFGEDVDLNNETSFLENGIIDSTGIMELVSFLEQTYTISIQDDELVPENLDSINNINNFLKMKL